MRYPYLVFNGQPNPFAKVIKQNLPETDKGVRAFNNWIWGLDNEANNWGVEYAMPSWLANVHNKYRGRCFLLGTGPSLLKQVELLPRLEKEYTFTCNRMAKFQEFKIRPFIHCVTEPQPFLEWGLDIVEVYNYPQAANKVACIWWPVKLPGWLWIPKAPEEIQIRWQGFHGLKEPLRPLPTGWASPLTIAQLAAWMGFTEFYFMGIDTTNVGQAWNPTTERATYPRNIRSICECFDRARMDIQMAGRKVYDCTPGGRINKEGILPYVELGDVLRDGA